MTSLSLDPATEWFLARFAVVALAMAVALLFWTYARRWRAERRLRNEITDLTITVSNLREENAELVAENKQMQQRIADLSVRQVMNAESVQSK
jgi:uncharacterized protein YlxW (UPF0749 family)